MNSLSAVDIKTHKHIGFNPKIKPHLDHNIHFLKYMYYIHICIKL